MKRLALLFAFALPFLLSTLIASAQPPLEDDSALELVSPLAAPTPASDVDLSSTSVRVTDVVAQQTPKEILMENAENAPGLTGAPLAAAPVIVAKMTLHSVTTHHGPYAPSEQVKLGAVYGKDGTANAQWAKATPSGALELTISNPEAIGLVKPGFYKVLLVPCGEDD